MLLLGIIYILPKVSFADTHRFVVEDPDLRIYPADEILTIRQKHEALNGLALRMKQGTAKDQTDFVKTALYEMAVLYDEEAVRQDKNTKKDGWTLARWRSETHNLAMELYGVADSINPETPVDISIADTGEIHLTVNQKLYIVSSPLMNKPFLLDNRIISNVCRIKYCDPESLSTDRTMNKRKRTISIEADWIVAENEKPRYVTSDGLNFVFNNLENRSRKQIASLKVIKEIMLIAGTLRDASNKGVVVEWDTLEVKPLPGSYDYRININQFGDAVYIKLPELHHVANWQEKIMPWIQAQVEEKPVNKYLDGDKFLAYAIHNNN